MGFFKRFGTKSGRTKYGNKRVVIDGMTFDSKKEYQVYLELLKMQEQGDITDLERQVKFTLIPTILEEYEVRLKTKTKVKERVAEKSVTYTADFVWKKDGEPVVCDVKASQKATALDKSYIIKRKIMRYYLGIKIFEVYDVEDLRRYE